MKAIITGYTTTYSKVGHVFELSEDVAKAVEEVKNGKDFIVIDKARKGKVTVVRKAYNGDHIEVVTFYPCTFAKVLEKEQIFQEYKDIIEFFKENQPCRKAWVEKHFGFKAERFFREAKAINLVKSTNRGFVLSEGI
ncbi:hypothetical protein DRP05_12085 [Archaeoglobales archaeon]|nr:MAG: hypothetical protein DRP05_12085 [Archaeoglobales archaeon]